MAEGKLRKWLSPKKRAQGYAEERKKGIHERGPNKDQPLDDYNKGLRSGYMLAQSDNAGLYRYKQAREAGVDMRVVRNTLARRAFAATSFECLTEEFTGPTLIAFSMEHPGAAARLFKEFAKTQKAFEVKAMAYEGEFIPATDIDRLATLPTYDEAIAKLMATMKEAAAGKLVRTIAAVRDQKEAEAA